MANISVPGISTTTPTAAGSVLGVQGGAVTRFNITDLVSVIAGTPIPPTLAASSRTLVAADNGSIIEATATITLTIPLSLPTGFGCTIMTNGTTTITGATGVTVNGISAGSVTRAATTNPIVSIIGRASVTNNYIVTGS